MFILKNSNAYNIPFLMVDSSDHLTPKTGLTNTVKISKNCSSFSTPSGSIVEISNGWYYLSGSIHDSNTYGPLILNASGDGADVYDGIHEVVAFNPRDNISLGLSFSNGVYISGIDETARNGIADSVLSRDVSNVEDVAGEHSLAGIILMNTESSIDGTTLTINKTDGSTLFASKSVSKTIGDAPIRGIS